MTTGRKNVARQNVRSASRRSSASASPSAVAICSGTWMARKTNVFRTACQKRVSCASVRTLSRPANDGTVTRSQCRPTSTSAKAIGYAANASRNTRYGAASSQPERSSARTEDPPRVGGGPREGLPDRHRPVDRARLVRLRQHVEDLDDVRVDVEVSRALHVRGVRGERGPARERAREARVGGERAPVGELARLLDEQPVGLGRGEEGDEP